VYWSLIALHYDEIWLCRLVLSSHKYDHNISSAFQDIVASSLDVTIQGFIILIQLNVLQTYGKQMLKNSA
jgi:hypothetical protein